MRYVLPVLLTFCSRTMLDANVAPDVAQADVAQVDASVAAAHGRISAGDWFTCAISASSEAVCWGYGARGEIGNGATGSFSSAQHIGLENVIIMNTGHETACALQVSGEMHCWGRGDVGQLGNGQSSDSTVPAQVSGLDTVVDVALGAHATCALRADGRVDCFGSDTDGELALGSVTSKTFNVPTLSTIGGVGALGGSGGDLLCATANDGVVCWGASHTSLGDGVTFESGSAVTLPATSGASTVRTNWANACIVFGDGALRCWGTNTYGQLGDGTTTDSDTPVPAKIEAKVADVAIGLTHECVLTTAGAVMCVGANDFGQLGNGTLSGEPVTVWQTAIAGGAVAVACGQVHSCAVLADGSAKCWGANNASQLGAMSSNDTEPTPVSVVGF